MKLTDYPPGATPLEPEDLERLIPDLATRAELNVAEQANIARAFVWARTNRMLRKQLLTVRGLQRLHAEMFSAVWKWAGEIRTRELNIGVAPHMIRQELPQLCGELAWIHPFLNGNGRHARLASDLLLEYHGESPLPWGGDVGLVEASPRRDEYIAALRCADRGDCEPLLRFATSF